MKDKKLQGAEIVNDTQLIYLDFDGADTVYKNVALDLEFDVQVVSAELSAETRETVIAKLNEKYQGSVVFTAEKPVDAAEYSTIFVGSSDDFDKFGAFQGVAENIDKGNLVKNDNAFVMVTAEMAADKIADVIAHEAGHLLGESHAVETGTLQDYAAVVPVVPPTPDVPDEKNEKYFVLDYDGDGVQELAFVNGKNCFSVYGKGTSLSVTDIADGFTVVGVGDFEATGKDGLLLESNGLICVDADVSDQVFSYSVVNGLGDGWNIAGVGNFNGESGDDILVMNPTAASETVGLLGYWVNGKSWTLINGYSPEWDVVAINDYNNDGKTDMLWRNTFEGVHLVIDSGHALRN